MKDKKVGDTVFLYASDRRDSYSDGIYFITKIGKKYLTINKDKDEGYPSVLVNKNEYTSGYYHLTKSTYGSGSYVFSAEKDCKDYLKARSLSSRISDKFRFGSSYYSLTQLEEVAKILGIKTE